MNQRHMSKKEVNHMFKVNDTVVYGPSGVCKITEITVKDFMEKNKEYYVLHPIGNSSTTLYAPTDNEAVLAKMRRVLSVEEIHKLIASASDEELAWIANDTLRREKFKEIIDSGDHRKLIMMIKAIWLHRQKRQAEGKKLYMADERFFKGAEQLLYDEFQYVLKINKEDLIRYIFNPK